MTAKAPVPGPRACVLVIFGATGDLTRRKLVPALYNLAFDRLLPERFAVVGVSRRPVGDEQFREELRQGLEAHSRRALDAGRWAALAEAIRYVPVDGTEESYRQLGGALEEVDAARGTEGNRLFYLSVPPSAFAEIVAGLESAGLARPRHEGGFVRIVIEKPIGRDLGTARALNDSVNRVFRERDVFRIDHYLGKETVQNLLVFRFANSIFEPLWNRRYVDHVQITVAEPIGVEGRGTYFEEAGMTRDMVQNHMFQLLCLTAMEPPVSLDPDAVRTEKVKVLQSLRPLEPAEVPQATVRAQYTAGVVGDERVRGYREEPGVSSDSRTETYVAMRLHVDTWRWAGVPFYLRAGKRLNHRLTEIAMRFKGVPHRLFQQDEQAVNTLALRIQPDEAILLKFDAKLPGTRRLRTVEMNFSYEETFGGKPPEAYERLLLDAMLGDSTLFIRRDEVESAWSWIDRVLEGWAREDGDLPLPEYAAGSWGPAEAHVMLARDAGRTWRRY